MMVDNSELLHLGEIIVEGRLVDASNATLFCEVSYEGQTTRAIYKPISGERPLWDFSSGDLASRERASYLVNQRLGMNSVPLTILRDGPFGFGMVQQWIDINEDVDLALYFREDLPELRSVALFDAIVNNTDRKIGHLLPAMSGDLYICDHGVTFHHEDKLRTVLWQWAGEELTPGEIETVNGFLLYLDSEESSEIQSLISEIEFLALRLRVERLLESGQLPMPNPDWPSVPWPPF
jgi:uncharacterized repeat protein (TIGR03843 family)